MVSDGGLTTYVVERYWPGVTEELLADALARVTEASKRLHGRLDHLESVLIPDEEFVFSVFAASSVDHVREANRMGHAPFERVVQATVLPGRAALRSTLGGPRR